MSKRKKARRWAIIVRAGEDFVSAVLVHDVRESDTVRAYVVASSPLGALVRFRRGEVER